MLHFRAGKHLPGQVDHPALDSAASNWAISQQLPDSVEIQKALVKQAVDLA